MFTYSASLDRVVDGDTIDLCVDLGFGVSMDMRIRLLGIDTPEVRTRDLEEKKRGFEAKNFVIKTFEQHDNKCVIETVKDKQGKFGRYLATVYFGDTSLNSLLIENNYSA